MKVVDVTALVVLALNAAGALWLAGWGGRSTWHAARRWSAASTATVAIAALVGGTLPAASAAVAVGAVWLIGWGGSIAARGLPSAAASKRS